MVSVAEAEALTGLTLPRLANSPQKWHCLEVADGTPLVCLQSLLKSGRNGT